MQSMGQHNVKVDEEQRKKDELENRIRNLEAKEVLALERLKRTEAMTQLEAEKLIQVIEETQKGKKSRVKI